MQVFSTSSVTSKSSYLMASPSIFFISFIIYSIVVSSNAATIRAKPNAYIIPIRKDIKSLQYYANIQMGDQASYIQATIDLGGDLVWLNCDNYTSSTKKLIDCDSKKCIKAGRIGCKENNTCGVAPYNPFKGKLYSERLDEDSITVGSTDGWQYLRDIEVANFAFSCVGSYVLPGLASGISGIVGLARTPTALQKQLASLFKISEKFALCIPSSNEKGFGDLFIGGGPYYMPPYLKDMSTLLIRTPIVTNPVSTAPIYSPGDPSYEYFIGVKSIKIGGRALSLNSSLLSIDKEGVGGAKLSTVAHFTTLHTSIYKAIASKFIKKFAAMNVTRVPPVTPFGACFSSKSIRYSKTGLDVPVIDLVLQNDVYWRMYGHNSMKQVNTDVACLAFVDGGSKMTTSIVLGGHQLEDNLIEFDLVSSKIGFSNSLLLRGTSCSHFRLQ